MKQLPASWAPFDVVRVHFFDFILCSLGDLQVDGIPLREPPELGSDSRRELVFFTPKTNGVGKALLPPAVELDITAASSCEGICALESAWFIRGSDESRETSWPNRGSATITDERGACVGALCWVR